MRYDTDIQRGRFGASLAAVLNGGAMLYYLAAGQWLLALLTATWMATSLLLMDLFHAEQRSRDGFKDIGLILSAKMAERSVMDARAEPGSINDSRLPPGSVN